MLMFALDTVYRGAPLPEVRYWSVIDTFIDQKVPERNFGRDQFLSGGPGKVVFLRFEDLQRLLPTDQDFDTAQIQLRQALGGKIVVKSIMRVQQGWAEGNGLRGEINERLGFPADQPSTGTTWQLAGNAEMTPIPGAKATVVDGLLRIEGLAALMNRWRNGEIANHGIAITFAEVVDFASSEAGENGPQLIFSGKAHGRTANRGVSSVVRSGAAVAFTVDWGAAGPITPEVRYEGRDLALTKLDSNRFSFTWPDATSLNPLEIRLPAADAIASDNTFTLYPGGTDFAAPIKAHNAVRFWNEAVAPHSRFSHARSGVNTRLNLWTSGDTLPGATLREQISDINRRLNLIPSTDMRDDGGFARQLPLMSAPWPDELADQQSFPETDLLSSAQVGQLNQPSRLLPKTIALRVVGPDGSPIAGVAKLSAGEKSKVLTLTGQLQLVNLAELTTSVIGDDLRLDVVTPAGELIAQVPRTEFFVAALRAGTRLPVVKIGVPLPLAQLEEAGNHALAKPVNDSTNADPAILAPLVDGDANTTAKFPEKSQWIELNLGRDRVFGAVDIVTALPERIGKILVVARETAQAIGDSEPFARMNNPKWHAANWCPKEGDKARLRLFGAALKARVIRIYFTGSGVEISEIRVIPAKITVQ